VQNTPRIFDDVAECVETTLSRVGPRIVLALPLGVGKPNPLANEFYRRVRRDPGITLRIFTALSLRACTEMFIDGRLLVRELTALSAHR